MLKNRSSKWECLMLDHISDHDLERCCLRIVPEGPERDALEEHLIGCAECVERAEETQRYVNTMRVVLMNMQD